MYSCLKGLVEVGTKDYLICLILFMYYLNLLYISENSHTVVIKVKGGALTVTKKSQIQTD